MSLSLFAVAAFLLALERVCYVWVARWPASFLAVHSRVTGVRSSDPTTVVERLFLFFKLVQAGVFAAWLWVHGEGSFWPVDTPAAAVLLGGAAVAAGQTLNLAVFQRLGRTGVFYGDRFGFDAPWVDAFPFSVCRHPQYTGTVLTIWGLFLIARFPHADWWALPALETLYYAIGARLESGSRSTISNARTSSVASR